MNPDNLPRAKRAARLVRSYRNNDVESDIIDTLADLRHLCDLHGLDFAALDEQAYGHYREEAGSPSLPKDLPRRPIRRR